MKKRDRSNMERNKKVNRKQVHFKPRFYVLIFVLLALIISAVIFVPKLFNSNMYLSYLNKRYDSNSKYSKELMRTNEYFNRDHYVYIDGKYVNGDSYIWRDATKTSLDKSLNIALTDYLQEKKFDFDKISISLVSLDNGERFNYNQDIGRQYTYLNRLLVNMGILKLKDQGKVSFDDKVILKEEYLDPDSYFYGSKDIGKEYSLPELLKLSFKNYDLTSRNMLMNTLIKDTDRTYYEQIKSLFDIDYEGGNLKTTDSINIARELYKNKKIYNDQYLNVSKEDKNQYFLNYLTYDDAMSYSRYADGQYYELGYHIGKNDYIYSLAGEDLTVDLIREIGDLLDRSIGEHFLLKKF